MRKYKIALIESTQRVIDALTLPLQTDFNAIVKQFYTSQEVIPYLKDPTSYDLIIVRKKINEESSAKNILNHLYDKKIKIPVISMGYVEFPGAILECLEDQFQLSDFETIVRKSLGISKQDLEQLKLSPYIPIPIHYFYLMTQANCNIFIKLSKQGEEQYVKRISEGDEFDKETILKYEKNGLKEFYIEYDRKADFLSNLMSNALSSVSKKVKTQDHSIEVGDDSYGLIAEMTGELGISPEVQQLAHASVQRIMDTIAVGTPFASFLKSILNNPASYGYRNSLMLSIIFHEILPSLDVGPTQHNFDSLYEKMVFVSYFHDMFIDNDDLKKIITQQQADQLSGKAKEIVMNHANQAATRILEFKKSPLGSDVIVRQHHGTHNGVGFKKPVPGISPLAKAFIICEDMVNQFLVYDEQRPPVREILTNLKNTYSTHSSAKTVQAIINVFIKNVR